MKKCTVCSLDKDFSDFYKKKSSKGGYRSECKKCCNEKSKNYKKSYYHKNKHLIDKGKQKTYMDEYKKTNKIHLNNKRKEYRKNKFKTDEIYKLSHNIRSLISNSIKKQGFKKQTKTEKILGCSLNQFKIYIESQFYGEMSWEN